MRPLPKRIKASFSSAHVALFESLNARFAREKESKFFECWIGSIEFIATCWVSHDPCEAASFSPRDFSAGISGQQFSFCGPPRAASIRVACVLDALERFLLPERPCKPNTRKIETKQFWNYFRRWNKKLLWK